MGYSISYKRYLSMEFFFDGFYSNPSYYISALFAVAGTIAFLLFLRGFLATIGRVFTISGNDDHLREGYTRAVWGVLLLFLLFTVWEVVRFIFGLFVAGDTPSVGLLVSLGIIWAGLWGFYWLKLK